MSSLRVWLVAAGIGLTACGTVDRPQAPLAYNDARACNPLGTVNCLMPWPSAVYLDEDPATATGYRINIPIEAMPQNIDGVAVDPAPYGRWDGFAPTGVIVAGFDVGVSSIGLPGPAEIGSSLDVSSPIVLLNMDTGERIPFFAETDQNKDALELQSLLIRPMVRMPGGARIAVAIRDTVKAAVGGDLPRPPGFEAVVAGKRYAHPLFDKVAPRYDDIFAALEAEGVSREELVLAWDFVVASDDFLTRDLLTMRDAALPAMGEAGANLSFELAERSFSSPHLRNSYLGTHTSPNFLTNGEEDLSRLIRDGDGLPVLDGEMDANFAAIIPKCMDTAELPRPVMIFGHGLFGTGQYFLDSGARLLPVAEDYCMVIVAGDWIGLTERQIPLAGFAANDANKVIDLIEKLPQSVINFISLEHLVRGPLAADARFMRDGQPMIDTSQVLYYGGSLGGIMGNVFMAYDPVVTRGALGVPGGAWSLMLERSFAWPALRVAMDASYENQYVYQTLVALFGMAFEPYDPITTSPRVVHDPLPGTPAKQVLLYQAMADSLVSNHSTELVARALDIDVVGPSVRQPWGLTVSDGPLDSGLAIYDDHATPEPPVGNVAPTTENGAHNIYRFDAVIRQVMGFLLEGEVRSECRQGELAVACDCSTGVCD